MTNDLGDTPATKYLYIHISIHLACPKCGGDLRIYLLHNIQQAEACLKTNVAVISV